MKTEMPLIGTWSLVAWYNEDVNAETYYPFGRDVSGYIHYSANGYVFVHMMSKDRKRFSINDPFSGSDKEYKDAFVSNITYAGPYEYCGDHIIHHVTQASFPNWIGSKQVRYINLNGTRLQLSAKDAVFQGKTVSVFVDWIRTE